MGDNSENSKDSCGAKNDSDFNLNSALSDKLMKDGSKCRASTITWLDEFYCGALLSTRSIPDAMFPFVEQPRWNFRQHILWKRDEWKNKNISMKFHSLNEEDISSYSDISYHVATVARGPYEAIQEEAEMDKGCFKSLFIRTDWSSSEWQQILALDASLTFEPITVNDILR